MPEAVLVSRAEHLAWCKQRALQYVELGELENAVASMLSDLSKHPETSRSADPLLGYMGMIEVNQGADAVRSWIEGF